MAPSTGWPAPAKINLFLHVVGRRPDGYHLLQTQFQFVDVWDELDFEVREDGRVRRRTDLAGVAPEHDLVMRAARLLKAEGGTALGADIWVRKRLPLGGGLGGGSSDAATALIALNRLWALGLTPAELAALGLRLGADVPVFVHGRAAWAEGIGERLAVHDEDESPIVVVTPDCLVDTARVFAAPELTRDTPPITMHGFSLTRTRNDCEAVTRRLYPAVGAALDWLSHWGEARMSGTGASVYAFFDDPERARAIASQVPHPWRALCGWRRNRSPLLDFLGAARDGGASEPAANRAPVDPAG